MSKRTAIVGAGTAGLHLGLYLQQKGVPSTIFTDKKIEDYPNLRLPNTVAHHAVTVAREDDLGVNHWPDAGYFGHYYFIGMPNSPIEFYGDLTTGPSRAVDYRIYLPTLMADFQHRGGRIEYRAISVGDLTELSAEYDLVVIGTGAAGLGQLFARDERSSPFNKPRRQLCAGLFKGIAQQETKAVTFGISPGAGELIEIPTVTFGGDATALLFENHPGSDLEVLAHARYEDNPRAFLDLVLDKLRTHYPITARRVNEHAFDLANSPLDILQGGVTPTVRHGHIKLENGATALLLGDAHATVDPLLGQGANMASYAAHLLGQQIVSADIFDEDFFAQVDARRANRVLGATRWTNFMLTALNTLPDAFTDFLGAVAENRGLADKFTDNFNYPEKQWDLFSNPDSVGPWIAKNSSVSQESQRPSHRQRPPATASWIGRTRGDGSPMTLMLTASDTARAVRSGDRDPVAVAGEALTRIAAGNAALGAFRRVRYDEALAEAGALRDRHDLAELPLAGVPIAVKDVVAVAGEYAGWGSRAGPRRPFDRDGDIVARLRAAGAVIVGLTRAPELCLWPMTDSAEAVVRNPWAPAYTAGGSSGGAAAAVAAGLVPLAHGTDAFGSLRSPAAICGLVGVTPGTGTVSASDSADWSGMYTHGPLATTVSDVALLLSVLAERPDLAQISVPGRLHIATSTQLPSGIGRVPEPFAAAVARTAELLSAAGHHVVETTPHYGNLIPALLSRWLAGPGGPPANLDSQQLERRTRTHLRAGRVVRRAGLVRHRAKHDWIARAAAFFAEHDVLITPMLATMPPASLRWSTKGWLANAVPSIRLTAFLGPWDLAGYPAMSVPAARHPTGLPIGVQLVAPPGGEARLLALAAQLEALSPWPRTAPQ